MYELASYDLRATTDGSGDAVGTCETPVYGFLYAIEWEDGDLVDGVDFVLSVTSGDSAVSHALTSVDSADADKWYYPRTLEHLDTSGANLATHGLHIVNGTMICTIANGGDTKTGGAFVHIMR